MAEGIALILQRVEGLVLYLPAGTPRLHECHQVGFLYDKVAGPCEGRLPARPAVGLADPHQIHPYVGVGGIQGDIVQEMELEGMPFLPDGAFLHARIPVQHPEQRGIAVRLDAADEVAATPEYLPEVWPVGVERILNEQAAFCRWKGREAVKQPLGRIQLAVILLLAVPTGNRLGGDREYRLLVGMDQDCAQHLVVVARSAIAMPLLDAARAADRGGGEEFHPVHADYVVAGRPIAFAHPEAVPLREVGKRMQEAGEGIRQGIGWYPVQNCTHLGVARDSPDPIDLHYIAGFGVGTLFELEHRGVLQAEHRKGRHQGIDQRDRGVAPPGVGYPAKGILHRAYQIVWRKLFHVRKCLVL